MGNEKKMMISHKIVMRLAEKGWRQSDLSRKSGIRHGTINACVNRGSKPRGMTLIKMAKGLDLDPEYLIEDSKDWPPSPEDRVVPQPGHKNTGPPRPYETAPLPHFGHIVAGDPTLPIQDSEGEYHVLKELWGAMRYVLTVQGESMHPYYQEGDFILIENTKGGNLPDYAGKICTVLFNGERTLKRIHMDKEGKVQLKPDNPYMPTIHVNASDELVILGLVLGLVWRKAR